MPTPGGLRFLFLCLVPLLAACGSGSSGPAIGVVPKGITHEFWQAVKLGADAAGKETGYAIRWQGTAGDTKVIDQLQIVEDLLSSGIKGLVLAPIHKTQSRKAAEDCKARGVPLAIIDSALDAEGLVTFAATDNRQGGVMAAREMGRLLAGKGKVAVVMTEAGSASTEDRESGFRDTIKAEFPGIQIVDEQFGHSQRDTSATVAADMLTRHADLAGLFGSNESGAYGIMIAVRNAKRAGQLKVVGFDAAEELIAALRDGTLQAVVVQSPWRMGYEGVLAISRKLKGEAVPARIDTGVTLVTKANLDTPEVQKLLHPGK